MKEHPPLHVKLRRLITGSLFLVCLITVWAGAASAQTTSSATTTTEETPPTQTTTMEATDESAPVDSTDTSTTKPVYWPTPTPTPTPTPSPSPTPVAATASCNATINARVVAFDQVYTYNRFGAFNPAGMIYALANDVVGNTPGNV